MKCVLGSEYILVKPAVGAESLSQKRHMLQAHGMRGVKSEDSYTYVRGRGRGKYMCQECGIRSVYYLYKYAKI